MSAFARHRWFLMFGMVCLMVGLSACGEGPTGSDERESLGAFDYMKVRAQLRARVFCRARYETCEGKPPPDHGGVSPEACLRQTVEEWEKIGDTGEGFFGVDPAVLQAIDAGTIDYDAEAAWECLRTFRDYVDQLSCIQARRLEALVVRVVVERDLIAVCPEVFTPQAEEGDECETSRECTGSLVCRRESGDGGDCGRCRPPAGPSSSTGSGFSYAREGESCGSPNHTPTCDPTEPLLCARSESGGWSCQPEASRKEGASCEIAGICESGLTCRDGECQPFDLMSDGDDCAPEEHYCEPPLICRASGADGRACAPIGRSGSDCQADSECLGTLWCGPPGRPHDQTGSCLGAIPAGEECDPADGHCASALYCEPGSETCQERLGEGETCSKHAACKPGLECEWERGTRERICQGSDEGEEETEVSLEACRP